MIALVLCCLYYGTVLALLYVLREAYAGLLQKLSMHLHTYRMRALPAIVLFRRPPFLLFDPSFTAQNLFVCLWSSIGFTHAGQCHTNPCRKCHWHS
jgi:hypothetical protein